MENFTYTLIEKQLNSMKKWAGFTLTNTCMTKKQLYFIWNWEKEGKKLWEERRRNKKKK